MKIISLRFKNINSLKDEHIIDFTDYPLSDTGIFAITGATGAGKSSILDAITLALYNRTPRNGLLNRNAIETYGSLITRHTNEAYSEVEYSVNNKNYRSKWEISRARTGNLRDYHMEITDLQTNKLIDVKRSEVPDKNTEIIGLSYEQFIKSILLSQGEFARFLKSSAAERGELLEKITGTYIYRQIGKAIFEKNKQAKIDIENINNLLINIDLLTDEQIQQIETEKKELQKTTERLSETIETKNNYLRIREQTDRLKTDMLNVEKELSATKSELKAFEPNIRQLKLHEKLMPHKGTMMKLQDLEENYKKENGQLDKNENRRRQLSDKHIELEKNLELLSNKKAQFQNELSETKPIIEKAKQLDKSIHLWKQKFYDISQMGTDAKKKVFQQLARIDDTRKDIDKNNKHLKSVNEWLNENKELSNLESSIAKIEERLNTKNHYIDIVKKQFDEAKSKAAIKFRNVDFNWESKHRIISNEIEKTEARLKQATQNISYRNADIDKAEAEREDMRNKYMDFTKINELAKKQKQLKSDAYTIEKQTDKLYNQQKENQQKKETFEQQIVIEEKHIEEAGIRYERQQLEAKYNDVRKKLKENQPCFLCGSTHHPYVESYENKADETKQFLNSKKTELDKLKKQLKDCELEITRFQTGIENNKKRWDEIEKEIDVNKEAFESITAKYNDKLTTDDEEKILAQIEMVKERGVWLKEQIEWMKKSSSLKEEMNELRQIAGNTEQLLEAEKKTQEVLYKYEYFLPKKIKDNDIAPTLKKLWEKHKENKQQQDKLKSNIDKAKHLLNEQKQLLERIDTDYKQTIEKKNDLEKQGDELKKQRILLLDGKSTDEVEINLQKKEKNLYADIAKQENQISKNSAELQAVETRIDEINQNISSLAQNMTSTKYELLPKLGQLNIDSVENGLDAMLQENQANDIKEKQQQLDSKKISLEQSLNDKRDEWKKNAALLIEFDVEEGNKSIERLRGELKNIDSRQQEANRRIGMLNAQIDENAAKQKRTVDLQNKAKKMHKEAARWNALNDIIGDAQGKRFAKFAQELTLLHLINQANIHLKNLNERYRIKKGNENVKDDLLVVDTFQGNNERSVRTLSGGESFLVSLALALGLSDLAGQNTRIESLFIDEGFGALDQTTLDIALSALEKLQSESNRTIGIISHVESLKERIRTQIVLTKSSSGYSTMEVRNL